MLNKKWLKASTIRAVKTGAQVFVASIGTSTLVEQVNWVSVASTVILSIILSYGTSLAGLPEASDKDAPNS